jgi:hypothetical protein
MTVEMNERTLKLRPDVPADEGQTTTDVRLDAPSYGSAPDLMPRHTPFFVPRWEAYYWTREWQRDEAEALKELRRGESRVFFDPKEAVRWLRSEED